ncbi:MAG: TPM domain-containing protein [Chlamydiota bacterium]|nr:TPM domain-containing protein [Chlamydiota bacterium]
MKKVQIFYPMIHCIKRHLFISILMPLLFFSLLTEIAAKDAPPRPSAYVNDFAHLLPAEAKSGLEKLLLLVEQKTSAEICIVTINTIGDEEIESYAVNLFESWGIGKKGKDNGVLLLIVPKIRKVRIEVGYGLEGALPDGLCGDIIRNDMVPFFKNNDYASGITQATISIVKILEKEYKADIFSSLENPLSIPKKPSRNKNTAIPGLISFFMLIMMSALFGRHKKGRTYYNRTVHWSGAGSRSGFSSGFGGFGGGFSGGGGATGSW